MKNDVYLEEYVKKRLIPFFRSISVEKVLFYPYLARVQYRNSILEELKDHNTKIVPKIKNQSAILQIKPTENFYSICKIQYKIRTRSKTNLEQFK